MRKLICATLAIGTLAFAGCTGQKDFDKAAIETEITQILRVQDAAWNAGDIDGFMVYYLASEDLRFASGGKINRGWQATIDNYKTRYPDKAAMGTLDFKNLEIKVLSPDYAQVFGRWELTRAHDKPGGLFTLLFNKQNGKWVIVSDHTSSNDSANPVTTDPVSIDAEIPSTGD